MSVPFGFSVRQTYTYSGLDSKKELESHVQVDQGTIFRTFFPRKIPRNFLEKQFFKTFCAENSIFPNIFGGKFSAEFSPKFSLEKMYEKSTPDRAIFRQN
jgi:hypothetical protein